MDYMGPSYCLATSPTRPPALDYSKLKFAVNKVYHTPFPNSTQLERRTTLTILIIATDTLQNICKNAEDCLNAIMEDDEGRIVHL